MLHKCHVIVGGENLIDRVQKKSIKGNSESVDSLGGSPYNVAVALARQKVKTSYITPISLDSYGIKLAYNLNQEGVKIASKRNYKPTTMAIVSLNDGIPSYAFQRKNTAERLVTTSSIKASIPADATHLHVGSLAFAGGSDADAWEFSFHEAFKNGLTTSLDPNIRQTLIENSDTFRERFKRLLKSTNILKLSNEDLSWIYPGRTQQNAINQLQSQTSAELIVLTKGAEGAECWTSEFHVVMPNHKNIKMLDTIGAGDTFMATMLAFCISSKLLLPGSIKAPDENQINCLLKRCITAALLNCSKIGCDPPTHEAINNADEE